MYVHDFIVSFLSGSASDHQGNHGLGHLGGFKPRGKHRYVPSSSLGRGTKNGCSKQQTVKKHDLNSSSDGSSPSTKKPFCI